MERRAAQDGDPRLRRQVTTEGGPDFVPVAERIATFDNDGTLWCEQPMYFQFIFALDRVKATGAAASGVEDKEPFKSVLAGDLKAVLAGGEKAIAGRHRRHACGHDDRRVRRRRQRVARHGPASAVQAAVQPSCVYQPMVEVLAYLRANGFKTFIVSGGGVEFMRRLGRAGLRHPAGAGRSAAGASSQYEMRDGKPVLVKLPAVDFIDDKAGKPVGIQAFIGRRPILAFGNSDGDFEMLQWTTARRWPAAGPDRSPHRRRARVRLRPRLAHRPAGSRRSTRRRRTAGSSST